tara:strand:+ start:548 stop:1105 length:558 start_codon:yes stop_codon:yes gene_type:complete
MYNNKSKKNDKRNDIPTPTLLCDFLYDLLIPHYKPDIILDPSSGDGRLAKPFLVKTKSKVIQYEIKKGKDFLKETKKINCDMVLCNPPFNSGNGKKLIGELFLNKIFELCGNDIPVIMFCPMGQRLNNVKKSIRWRDMRDILPPITTIITLPIDIFDDTKFHSEILCFNTDKLNPHYFLPDDVIL